MYLSTPLHLCKGHTFLLPANNVGAVIRLVQYLCGQALEVVIYVISLQIGCTGS